MSDDDVFLALEQASLMDASMARDSDYSAARAKLPEYSTVRSLRLNPFPFKLFLLSTLSAYALLSFLQAALFPEVSEVLFSYLSYFNQVAANFWIKLSIAMIFSIWLISDENYDKFDITL